MLKWLWILSLYKFWFLSIKAHVPSCGLPVMLILLRSPLFLLLFSGQSYFSTCTSLHLNCSKFPRHCLLPFSVVQKMKYDIHFYYRRCPSDRPLSLGTTDKAKQSQGLYLSRGSHMEDVRCKPSTQSPSDEPSASFLDRLLLVYKLEAIHLTAAFQPLNWMYNLIYKLMFSISRTVINRVCAAFLMWICFLVSLRVDVACVSNSYEFLNTGFFNLPVLISFLYSFYWERLWSFLFQITWNID